jgi:two-component system nitrate/nitrite response regulator NarL
MTIRVVLADDHPIFRDGLVRSLEESGQFSVVGTGGNADEAVALVAEHAPDLVLLDISMPGSGIEAARRISAGPNPPRIAMVTVSEHDQDVTAAFRAGAIGYVLKGISAAEIAEILTGVAAGEAHVSPALASRLLQEIERPAHGRTRRPIDELSKRESDILRRVARGLSNREVADDLGLQEKTIKHYMTSILEKLQVRNRVEAALIARDAWGER